MHQAPDVTVMQSHEIAVVMPSNKYMSHIAEVSHNIE